MSDLRNALLFEREGYLRRDLPERVAQVDEQLAQLEAAEPEPAEPEPPIEEAVAQEAIETAVSRPSKRSRNW